MKKIFILIGTLFLLTGCGNEKMICKYNYKGENYEYENEVTVIIDKEGNIKQTDLIMTYVDSKNALSTCEIMKKIKPEDITCDNNRILVKNYHERIEKTTKEEIKQYFKENRYYCNENA